MPEDADIGRQGILRNRTIIVTSAGIIFTILLIIVTLEISHRNVNPVVHAQQKYILTLESAVLVIFIVEMLARLAFLLPRPPQMVEYGTRLRLLVRVVGYTVGSLSVVSILASNATLGISVGAIAGVVIAFATQNIVGSVLACVVLLTTHVVRVGEEITFAQTKGVVSDFTLTHTVLSIDDEVVFVPNSLMISNMVRRKKRDTQKGASVRDW